MPYFFKTLLLPSEYKAWGVWDSRIEERERERGRKRKGMQVELRREERLRSGSMIQTKIRRVQCYLSNSTSFLNHVRVCSAVLSIYSSKTLKTISDFNLIINLKFRYFHGVCAVCVRAHTHFKQSLFE